MTFSNVVDTSGPPVGGAQILYAPPFQGSYGPVTGINPNVLHGRMYYIKLSTIEGRFPAWSVVLPIAPEQLTVTRNSQIQTFDIVQGGQYSVSSGTQPEQIKFEVLLPMGCPPYVSASQLNNPVDGQTEYPLDWSPQAFIHQLERELANRSALRVDSPDFDIAYWYFIESMTQTFGPLSNLSGDILLSLTLTEQRRLTISSTVNNFSQQVDTSATSRASAPDTTTNPSAANPAASTPDATVPSDDLSNPNEIWHYVTHDGLCYKDYFGKDSDGNFSIYIRSLLTQDPNCFQTHQVVVYEPSTDKCYLNTVQDTGGAIVAHTEVDIEQCANIRSNPNTQPNPVPDPGDPNPNPNPNPVPTLTPKYEWHADGFCWLRQARLPC